MRVVFVICFLIPHLIFGQINPQSVPKDFKPLVRDYNFNRFGSLVIGHSTPKSTHVVQFGEEIDTGSSLFNVASVSKTFTGLAILKLIQEDKLSPEDPIGQYIACLQPELAQVTVEELAFHTNGIHDYFSLYKNHRGLTNAMALQKLCELDSTVFEPSSNWGYSNSGYLLLAEIIEAVSKQSYSSYLTKNIFGPLGIQFAHPFNGNYNNVLVGHSKEGSEDSIVTLTYGSGNLLFTVNDVLSFGNSLRTNQNLKEWISIAQKRSNVWIRDENWDMGYGFWFSEDQYGPFMAGSGRSFGSIAYYRYYFESEDFIFYLSNQDTENNKEFRNALIRYIME